MTYLGDSNLSEEIRQRVLETFEQSRQLAVDGKQQEATLGCEFVLRLDPLFEPARDLIDQIASGASLDAPGDAPAEAPMPDFGAEAATGDGFEATEPETTGSPLEDFDLGGEIDDLLDRRDFRTLMSLAEDHKSAVQASSDLSAKVAEAAERLEAEPYMRDFLDKAEKAQREGRADEAEALVLKARELDPLHPGLPPEAPSGTVNEGNDRIRELIEEGEAAVDRGDYQGAIDSWSRIFLIDIDHPEANKRIEAARRMKAENERKVEEAFHEGVSLWELGTTDKARELFERVLELDSSHPGARDYLDRMDARPVGDIMDSPDPDPAVAEAELDNEILLPPDPGTKEPQPVDFDSLPLGDEEPATATGAVPKPAKGGLLQKKFLLMGGGGLLLLVALLAFLFFKKDAFFPNSDAPVQEETVDFVARAQEFHDAGRTEMAIDQLAGLGSDHPSYAEAQALIAQWQAPVEEEVEAGPTEEELAARDEAVAQAQEARLAREYLLASQLFDSAAQSAPLDAEDELVREEVRQRLSDLQPQIEMFRQGDWEFVLPELWRLHGDTPDNRDIIRLMVDSYYNLGVRDLQRGDVEAASEKLERAAELNPGDAGVERLHRFSEIYQDRAADLLYRIFVKYLPFR